MDCQEKQIVKASGHKLQDFTILAEINVISKKCKAA